MTPEERAAAIARILAGYDQVEDALRKVIARPHWKIRAGKLVLDATGSPVPDPRPAKAAQAELDRIARDRKRLTR